jgi:hypothetical protein
MDSFQNFIIQSVFISTVLNTKQGLYLLLLRSAWLRSALDIKQVALTITMYSPAYKVFIPSNPPTDRPKASVSQQAIRLTLTMTMTMISLVCKSLQLLCACTCID